jgi:hypothetical protein
MDPYTRVLPGLKVMVDRATWWEFAWQQTLLTTRPQQIQDRVDDPPVHRSCAVARLAVQ